MYSEPCRDVFSALSNISLHDLARFIGSALGMSLSSFCQSSKMFLPKCYTLFLVLDPPNGVH